jgi:hypothetical protein
VKDVQYALPLAAQRGWDEMTKNRINGEIAIHSKLREEPLRNTQDPLPWLIRTLRQQQEKLAKRCQLSEPCQDTHGTP